MLLTIIAIFFLCWGPRLILNVMFGHELKFVMTPAAFKASVRKPTTSRTKRSLMSGMKQRQLLP